MTSQVSIVDSRERNPAFFNELKAVCKKEHAFREVYEDTVKNFFRALLSAGCEATFKNKLFSEVISKPVLMHEGEKYKIVKFRAKSPGKGSSESPRICVAVIYHDGRIIPLTIYTHGDTRKEPQVHDLLQRLRKILDFK